MNAYFRKVRELTVIACAFLVAGCGSLGDTLNSALGYGAFGAMVLGEVMKSKANHLSQPQMKPKSLLGLYYDPQSRIRVTELSMHQFADNDTLWYLQLATDYEKPKCFYYMVLDAHAKDVIMENALDKSINLADRSQWLTGLMRKTGVEQLNPNSLHRGNKYWTYWKRQPVFTKDFPDCIPSGVNGMGELPFNYKYAKRAYEMRKASERDMKMMMLIWMAMESTGYKSKTKYHCNGVTFDNYADMLNYKNAYGL